MIGQKFETHVFSDDEYPDGKRVSVGNMNVGAIMIQPKYMGFKEAKENADRIAACINALSGLETSDVVEFQNEISDFVSSYVNNELREDVAYNAHLISSMNDNLR